MQIISCISSKPMHETGWNTSNPVNIVVYVLLVSLTTGHSSFVLLLKRSQEMSLYIATPRVEKQIVFYIQAALQLKL